MKTLIWTLLVAMAFVSCQDEVEQTVTYKINEPVFMSRADFNKQLKVTQIPHQITGMGKMCYYEGYLYMTEPEKGIHIINDADPANPIVAGYIELLGNEDISIRNNMLYADSYTDLLWFDITDPSAPKLQGRLEKAFPEVLPPIINGSGIDYPMLMEGSQGTDSICVGWTEVQRTEAVDNYRGGGWWGWPWFKGEILTMETMYDGSTGVNGSMSRFAIYNDHLYSVMNSTMNIFDLAKDTVPVIVAQNIWVSFNVETIFGYQDKMFMGTPTGMVIFSVANPEDPKHLSTISHVRGCDPVVVEDDIAYVTIRSGNLCGQTENQLIVYSVKDPTAPKLLVSYGMTNPKGLGINNKSLFLCDDGLKVFDATDPQTLVAHTLVHYKGMDGYDLIPFNNVLMMVADDGIYQYDYTDLNNISLMSKIPILRPDTTGTVQ